MYLHKTLQFPIKQESTFTKVGTIFMVSQGIALPDINQMHWEERYRETVSKIHTYTHMCAKLLQLGPTLCDSMDCSPPGSSVHGILQARILE